MRPAAAQIHTVSGIEYFCPMHPQVVQDEPGSCPICGMTLASRKKGATVTLPAGVTARVSLAPARVAQAGIKTDMVAYSPLIETIKTVGSVAFDERRIASIVSKVPGKSRVEKLHVNVSGQNVEVGQTLAELYSPELNQAIQELLSAFARANPATEPRSAVASSLVADLKEMVRASSEKLMRWGLTQAQIDEILKNRKSDFTTPIFSPVRGHVFNKHVVQGQEVREGDVMFEVVDLQTVWVQAQVYEQESSRIREGQTVEATVEALPGETFSGVVEFSQPHVDPGTRTVEVRFALENGNHRLRPGMFATVTIKSPLADNPAFRSRLAEPMASDHAGHLASAGNVTQQSCPVTNLKLGSMGKPISVEVAGRKILVCCSACPPKLKAEPAVYLARLAPPPPGEVLSVPESAVIDTGARKVVYVESEPGVFDGREVVLGPRSGDRFPVLEGLLPGERVAAAGAFLIDAESRLSPAAVGMTASEQPEPPRHDHTQL
jgi:Cu(I)/Ag(I) efflux system membrane fusion protein